MKRIIGILCLLIAMAGFVRAQFDEDGGGYPENFEDQVVEETILSSPDVKIEKLFPRFNDTRIPIGEIAEVLIGFINTGNKVFNVTIIRASLLYIYDNSVFRNFTTFKYEQLVGPSEVVSFSYQFLCDQSLEPRDYGFQVWVLYTDNDNYNYTNTFNYTIDLYEPVTEFDIRSLFSTLLTIGLVGLGGFLFFKLREDKKKKKKGGSGGGGNDWSSGTPSSSFKKKKEKEKKN